MRVRFEWRADPVLDLPLGYHQILQGIIYQNLKSDYGYSDFIHDKGYTYGKRSYGMFCFSDLNGKHFIKNKRIHFFEEIFFEVSSPEVFLIHHLIQNVEKDGLIFGDRKYEQINIYLSDEEVEETEIVVRALSPITVHTTENETGKTYYFSPFEEEFSKAVNYNFLRKYNAYFGMPARESIWIEPVKIEKKDKIVTKYKKTWITGYMGVYRLVGKRQYLNFLYQAGVGSKNSQGFGLIEQIE